MRRKRCGARRRDYSCRCTRERGHRGAHRCGRSGVMCKIIGGRHLNRGPVIIPAAWR